MRHPYAVLSIPLPTAPDLLHPAAAPSNGSVEKTEGPGHMHAEINITDVFDIQGQLVDYLDDM